MANIPALAAKDALVTAEVSSPTGRTGFLNLPLYLMCSFYVWSYLLSVFQINEMPH